MTMTREELIADTFVELADTLVAEFDVIDFLHTVVERTVSLLDADAGGIMLADQRGGLEVLAASTTRSSWWNCSSCSTTRAPASRRSIPAEW